MNFPNQNVSAAELIAQYGPKRTGPYVKLRAHAEFIGELRRNHASYDTIVAILRERHGVKTSDTTVRKFCRDVLKELPPRQRRRPAQFASAVVQPTPPPPISPRPVRAQPRGGPQIAEVEFIENNNNQP